MKDQSKFVKAAVFFGCLLSAGCVAHAKHGTPSDNIMTALKSDMAADKSIANGPASPQNINQALLQGSAPMGLASSNIPEKRFDISVKNAPAKSFFLGLVAGTPYNMVVSPDIAGTISLELKNVSIQEALDAVRDIYGYDYMQTPYGFEVLPPTLKTQIFAVNYLDVQRDGSSNVNLNTGDVTTVGSTSTGTTPNSGGSTSSPSPGGATTGGSPSSGAQVKSTFKSDFWTNLQATLSTMVGVNDGRSVVVNSQAGLVVVKGYPKDLRSVGEYLDTIQNHMNRQVVLEAEILEVSLNDEFKSGINWRLLNFEQGNLNNIVGDASRNAFNASSSAPPFAIFSSGNPSTKFQTLIDLLETQGTVKVLSSPRVSTVNNQQAVIKVGSSSFFVTNVTSNQSPSGTGTSTSSSVTLTPFFSGITLDVTPQISKNGDVVLHVHPSVSKVVDDNKSVNLGTQGTLQLPLAKSTVRESDDIVRAKNGQIIVIGGLMSRQTDEESTSVPGASRVPFFGNLFRSNDQTSEKVELVILLRPVVPTDKTWGDQLKRSQQEFKEVDRGYHVGSRPEIFGTEGEVND